jgi:hypothetical protein
MLGSLFGVDDKNALYVTNVHASDGFFTAQKTQKAIDFDIPWIGSSYLENVRNVSSLSDFKIAAKQKVLHSE